MEIKELFDLRGKVAIVTGGAGLFGFGISSGLCEAGAACVVASRSLENCAAAAGKLKARGYDACAKQLDIASEESIICLVQEVIRDFGQIDILVNGAIMREGMADIESVTREGWELAQKGNSTGLMLVCREVVRHMRERGKGSIINISSIHGVNGPNFPAYGETGMSSPINYTYDKWGMIGLTKWMANYYGKYNVRVNSISPGGYNPELTKDEGNEFVKNYKRLTPLGRFAVEDDIKGPVVFLASDASKFVTGHNLMVDGRWSCW